MTNAEPLGGGDVFVSTSSESKTRALHEHNGKRKGRFNFLVDPFFSSRFSFVLFVLAVAEGILWLYPVYCNSASYITEPPKSFEQASLQDYFLANLASLKNTDYKDSEPEHGEPRPRSSHQKDVQTEHLDSLKLHSQQIEASKPGTQALRISCLLEVALLMLISSLQADNHSSSGSQRSKKRRSNLGLGSGCGALFLVAVLLLPCMAVGAPTSVDSFKRDSLCDLECWLSHLTIEIPDQHFESKFFGIPVTGSITGFQCSKITLGGISASVIPPTGIDMQATGVGIDCHGNWAYSLGSIKQNGDVSAEVAGSYLDIALEIEKSADGRLANSTSVTKCSPNIVISDIEFHGGIGELLDLIKSLVIPLLDSALNTVVCEELTTLVNVNLTAALQGIDNMIRPYLKPVPPQVPPAVPQGSMNFKSPPNPLVELLDYILDVVVGITGPLNVNMLIDAVTDHTGAVDFSKPCIEGGLFSVPLPVPNLGTIVFGLCSIHADNLDTWNAFDVLKPIQHGNHSLGLHTGMEELHLNISFFVNVSLSNGTIVNDNSLYEEGIVNIKLKHNELHAAALMALSENFFSDLQVPNDLLAPGGVCLAKNVWDVNITEVLFNVTVEEITLTAVGGKSEHELDDAISTIIGLLINSFNPAIPALLNGLMAGPLREQLNVLLVDELATMHQAADDGSVKCGIPPDIPDTFARDPTIIAFGVTLGIFFLLMVYFLVVLFVAERGKRMSILDPAQQSLLGEHPVHKEQELDDNWKVRFASMMSSCLALDKRLPAYVRYSVPCVILLNIGLFISSNSSTGASVTAVIQLGDELKELPPVFAFSLTSSVEDMWTAKVYALSILIALLSGGWPYLKLVLMLVCWVLPTKILSVRGREYFLMVLDALGKWSLIDAFVMVLMMTTFSMTIADPGHNGIIHVYVVPNYGFHAFMAATMISLAITHIILAFHRHVKKLSMEGSNTLTDVVANEESSTDCESDVSSPAGGINDDSPLPDEDEEEHAAETQRRALFLRAFSKWNKTLGIFIALMLILCIVLIVGGSIIESFRFEVEGLAGLVVDFLGGESVKSYSVIDVGMDLPSAVPEPDGLGVRWIQAAYFVLVMGVPLATLVALLVLWLLPMTIKWQRKVFHITEVLHAWSSLEVYLLAVVAALLEIEQFAQFIIGDKCDLINQILKKYFGDQMSHPICFDIETVLINSFWYLLGAAIIYMATAIVVMWVCHKSLEKHDAVEQRRKRASLR